MTERVQQATQRASRVLQLSSWRERDSVVAGSRIAIIFDEHIPDAGLYGGINTLEPGTVLPVHWHSLPEFQYILEGEGQAIDGRGLAVPVEVGSCVYSPAGRPGAHGFANSGKVPLVILFMYPSPEGARPDLHHTDVAVVRAPQNPSGPPIIKGETDR